MDWFLLTILAVVCLLSFIRPLPEEDGDVIELDDDQVTEVQKNLDSIKQSKQ